MSLIGQILEPLVEDDVATPAAIELGTVHFGNTAQFTMPVVAAQSHRFSQPSIQVRTHRHIRICDALAIVFEVLGQGQRNGVSASLQNLDIQLAIAGYAGSKAAVQTFEFRN